MLGDLPAKGLNMHGMWPQNMDGSYPQFCTSDSYNDSNLSDELKARMSVSWNGLYNSTFWFRTHEYNKHGTCFESNKIITGDLGKDKEFDARDKPNK
jgi:ribonuclease T2